MYFDDKVYRLILSRRLPLARGNKTVKEFLRSYYNEFIDEYKSVLQRDENSILRKECYDNLERYLPTVEKICDDILLVFDLYDSGNMSKLYSHFSEMMTRVKNYLNIKSVDDKGYRIFRSLYRIRAGKETFSRKEMFHIPMDKRYLINSYRYSIPGYPCLYLSTGLQLCWYECGMPKEFNYASFNLVPEKGELLKIIDFTHIPIEFVSGIDLAYKNNPKCAEKYDEYIAHYLVCFPLQVACSLSVTNRNVSFVEEYIFPQQLLLWVRENDFYDGIAYRTASSIEKARNWNYINLVMPVKNIQGNFSQYLNDRFYVSEPQKLAVRDIYRKDIDKIETVKDFVERLVYKQYSHYNLYPYEEIIALCKNFLNMHQMLINDAYDNAEAIYQNLYSMELLCELIITNISNIQSISIDKEMKINPYADTHALESDYASAMKEFKDEIVPIISDFSKRFMNIDNCCVDPTSYEHAISDETNGK